MKVDRKSMRRTSAGKNQSWYAADECLASQVWIAEGRSSVYTARAKKRRSNTGCWMIARSLEASSGWRKTLE